MKQFIIALLMLIVVTFIVYKIGMSQARLNVYNYDKVGPHIRLACIAMIKNKPTTTINSYVDEYYLIRETKERFND